MQNLPYCDPTSQAEDPKDALHYLHNSAYGDLDWELTLDYMTRSRNRHRAPVSLRLFVLLAGTVFGSHTYCISPKLSNIWTRKAD
jgi:hypothetical protein